jgi:tRNA (adenine37-N6)-methyltransferase
MTFTLQPIGHVTSARDEVKDDDWGQVTARIKLDSWLSAEALAGLDQFSHAEILFVFDRVEDAKIELTARHPRNNKAWPKVGIFAQRGKNRPNKLGSTIVEIVEVEGRTLVVRGLDAIDGTPVIDIKPVMREFLPRGLTQQPKWVDELMQDYWAIGETQGAAR